MKTNPSTKIKAQQRADRIRAFRDELEQVERDGALALTEQQQEGLRSYHTRVLGELQAEFDVDTTQSQKEMSWGMRIASTIGALALGAAVWFFFYRFWGLMTTPMQVGVLLLAPLGAVAGMEWCGRREKTLYFTGLVGMLAVATFVLNISMLGSIFNIKPSENAFLLWGAFALLLAYTYGLRLILAAGLLSLMSYLALSVGAWSGVYWIYLGQRPESYIAAGAAAFAVPLVFRHRVRDNFPQVYRIMGLLAVFIAVLVLSNWGYVSYLPLTAAAVEIFYQVLGFLLAGLTIWIGIRMGWRDATNTGMTFFVIFLYTKFFDWWWDLMPKYLFFLVLGLVAVGLLFLLKRFRAALKEA